MVQVLPAVERPLSPGAQFLKSLGVGLGQGVSKLPELYMEKQSAKQENEALKKLGIDIGDIRDAKTRRQALVLGLQGKIKQELAQSKPEKEITPYQQELIKQRGSQLELQKNKLEQAREKGRKELPQMIASYTKSYAKDLGLHPDEKVQLDRLVNDAYSRSDVDLNDALSQGIEQLAQRREALEGIVEQLPSRPFGADFRGEAKTQAMQQTAVNLKQAFDSGLASQKQLGETLKDKGWKKEEIDQIMSFISGAEEKPEVSQAKNKLEKFDSKNPQHVARAKQLLNQTGGDKAKANALLAQEFSR
jgi:hypothetical protein